MSYGDLKITFHAVTSDPSPLIVTVNRWQSLPRIIPQDQQSRNYYVPSGNMINLGVGFEQRPEFLIDTFLSQNDCDKLQMMWIIREHRRRNNLYWAFFIDDETEYICEETTAASKTRSHVAGTSVIEKNKGCYYFPRWACDMPFAPEFGMPTGSGNRQAIFTLQETGVKI